MTVRDKVQVRDGVRRLYAIFVRETGRVPTAVLVPHQLWPRIVQEAQGGELFELTAAPPRLFGARVTIGYGRLRLRSDDGRVACELDIGGTIGCGPSERAR